MENNHSKVIILAIALSTSKLLWNFQNELYFCGFVEVTLHNENAQRYEFTEVKRLGEECSSWDVDENIICYVWK
jgi:hypothetical protein